MRTCNFIPADPNNGAYGHWRCQRRRFHLGSHRYINYVVRRVRWRMAWITWPLEAVSVWWARRTKPWKHLRSARDRAFGRSTKYDPLPIDLSKRAAS